MKVHQLREVLKAAAELRGWAGDKEGALALLRFADEVAAANDKSVGYLAKQMSVQPTRKALVPR